MTLIHQIRLLLCCSPLVVSAWLPVGTVPDRLIWASTRSSSSITTLQMAMPSPQNSEASGDLPKPTDRPNRKKKKNKYEKFSKVQEDKDPFDDLLAETQQKVAELEREKQEKKIKAQPKAKNVPPPPKITFPDNKEIDPYDPTTFGYTEIGFVTGAHGVNGWLKVQSTTDFSVERLCTAGIRHLKPARKRAPRQVVLIHGKHRLEDEYLVQIEDVTDRDAALQLRGSTMYVRQEDPTPMKQDEHEQEEYLVSDLVGLEVRMNNNQQTFLGKVNSLVLSESDLLHDTLEVTLQEGPLPSYRDELVLIPLVEQIVPVVDVNNGIIQIDPPEGLLDLTYVRSERVRIKGFLPASEPLDAK